MAVAVGAAVVAAAGASVSSGATGHGCAGRVSFLVSVRTGAIDCAFPGIDAIAAVPGGDGGWLVGVRGLVGGVRVPGIARLDSDGRLDRTWQGAVPRTSAGVLSLTMHANMLYAGGSFGIEALNASTGSNSQTLALDGPRHPKLVSGGTAIAASANQIFIG